VEAAATRRARAVETDARLEVIAGPLSGKTFPMNREEVSIGREPSNEISFLDSSVSRRHCLIRKEGEVFQIRDLESRNGTFVNGVPLKERTLEHTDQIQIGSSILVFLTSDAARENSSSVQLDGAGPACPTVILRKGDALYLKPPEEVAHLPVTARGTRELNALSNFSRAVNSVRSVEALQKKVLESLLEIAPAVRAAILLTDESTGAFTSVLGWDRSLGPNQPVRVSQTIAAHVLEEGVAVLCNDIPEDADFHAAESLVTPGIRSVLAVPLAVFDKTIGLLYLDADDPKMKFDRGLLELVTALGNVAALAIENARRFEWLEGENQRLLQELNIEHNMIGESPAMRDVYNFISKVAARESSVLIWGESGTGKELVARAIHRNSGRAAKPFVAINCAAIAETLLESELFGHEKGAFTGAVAQKRGKLELADGGTVFLDEIGELALPLQSKLLRVLQEREVERVGGTRTVKLDIRLVAATNRDLKAAVRSGTFREDLYYRLNVVSIRVPALRERREDISLLASYFTARSAEKVNRRVMGISPSARACLMRYDWPGNVRELENAIERAVVLGSSEVILPEDLPDGVAEEAAPGDETVTPLHDAVREAKKLVVWRAIEQAGENYTEAAKSLGVHPNHLFRLVAELKESTQPRRQVEHGQIALK
jgi:Nif-specific regulatory protein